MRHKLIRIWTLISALLLGAVAYAAPPAGFIEQTIPRPDGASWDEVVGLQFSTDGTRMFAWERKGRVWIVDESNPLLVPFLDINDEVGGWRDYGLLGFTLHHDFENTGHVFLFYVVDRHHLMHCQEDASGVGIPVCDAGYNPATNEYFNATIGRITRYTAVMPAGDTGYSNATTVDYTSRKVLLGETPQTGIPILHQSHGTGAILFGTDGSLLASNGDGASYSSTDTGNAGETYFAQGLVDGIIQDRENVGSYRSQMLGSHNGKILRIDPETGDGLQSNPFYDTANPRSSKSRTWALGLRNPFRFTLRPGTGDHDPTLGQPGTLYIGDVGWGTWEDLNISRFGGENFGWPAFEGMDIHSGYWNRNTYNQDAPNPLFGVGGCTQEYFYFRNLIQQDTLNSPLSFPNPCDAGQEVPATIDVHLHARPTIDWRHGENISARWATYNGNDAEHPEIGQSNTEGSWTVLGIPFSGNSSTGGVFYTGDDFPAMYKNTYFQGDFGTRWIRNIVVDENDMPVEVREFDNEARIVFLGTNPVEGHLYTIEWATNVQKILYAPGGNQTPNAVITYDTNFGGSPAIVNFDGTGSSDPDGMIVSYDWDFGDTNTSTLASPSHQFTASGAGPETFTVTLTVTDNGGATDVTTTIISLNNSPPAIDILSPPDGALYPLSGDTVYNLIADISDAEHDNSQLNCAWQTILHHNNHTHNDPFDFNCATTTVISPLGCGTDTYYWRITLSVTDPEGLSTYDEVALNPNCDGNNIVPIAIIAASPASGNAPLDVSFDASSSSDPDGSVVDYSWNFGDGNFDTGASVVHQYTSIGSFSATLTITDNLGATSQASVSINVAGGNWWNTTWSNRRKLSFDNTGINENLAGFPILVKLDPTRINYAQTMANGEDLRFIDADSVTILNHEIATWNPGGDSTVFVSVTQIDANSNTDHVWMYYGNAVAADNQAPGAVWGSYAGVWHLDNDENDSTSNANHGTNFGAAQIAGTIGDARLFDGASYIDAGNGASLDITGEVTISAWVQIDTAASGAPRIVSKKITWKDASGYNLEYKPSESRMSTLGSGSNPGFATGVALGTTWHHLIATNNNGVATLFVDGVNVTTDAGVSPLGSGATPLNIGRRAGGASYLNGIVDEVRISPITRSPDWINAQFRNQGDSMVGYGAAETGTVPPFVSLTQPANGATFVDTDTVSLLADASDPDGTVAQVDFFAGTTLIDTDFTSPYSGNWINPSIGTYSLTAVATDDLGASTTSAAAIIEVFSAAPSQVVIDSPLQAEELTGSSVTVQYTISGNASLYDHIHLTLNGNPHVTIMNLTGSYTFDPVVPGAHTITAELADQQHVVLLNPEATDSVSFSVVAPVNNSPAVSAGPDIAALTGATIHIEGSATDDGLPGGTLNILWSVTSGPGVPSWPQNDQDDSHTHVIFPIAGAYVLRLTADDTQLTTNDEVTITVTDPPNQPPVASFTANPTAGPVPLDVALDASASSDPDGSITDFSWDFGDGGFGNGVMINNQYNGVGSYTVTLTVTDDKGGTSQTSQQINVNGAWWDTAWLKRRKLTLDNVAGAENLVDFPILVNLDSSRIDYADTQANGEDLRFVDSDGVTSLNYEITIWNNGGASTVFVKVPQIDAASNTDHIWMYYSNSVVADGQNPAGVWADYAGVWHLDDDENDSTANANHGTNFGSVQTGGVIGSARQFDGASYIDAGNDVSLDITGAISIEAWVQYDAAASGAPRIVSKKISWADPSGYNLEYKPSNSRLTTLGSGNNAGVANGVSLGTVWHHLAAVNDNGVATLYVDGVNVTSDAVVSPLASGNTALNIGRRTGNGSYLIGLIDELRISPTSRSSEWFSAQIRSSNDSVITYGAPELGTTPPSVSLTAPAEGATFVSGDTVTLSADASDTDGQVVQVDFYANATLIGSDSATPWTVNWVNPAIGSHALTAVATDNQGAATTSAVVNIEVFDSAPPMVVIDSPIQDENVSGTGVTVLYSISGNASLYEHLHLTLDANPHVTIVNLSGSYTFNPVAPGPHTITAKLADQQHIELGNPEAIDTVGFAMLAPPNQDPVASFTAIPSAGLAPLDVAFDASASNDPDGSIVDYAWNFGDGGSGSGINANYQYTAPGAYTATLAVTDNDGAVAQTTLPINVAGAWWDAAWSDRSKLSFGNTGINENLMSFPVLVKLDPTRINYGLTSANGQDLRFIDADGVTVLNHEIATWNSGGISTVFVSVPQIDADSSTDHIWLYYGNGAAADIQAPGAVWVGYAGVWHLDGDENDSTVNANHGTNFGAAQVAGSIGDARQFDGSSYIDAGNGASLNITGAITIEAWVQMDAAASGAPRVVSKKIAWTDPSGYNLEYKPSESKMTTLGSGNDPGIATGVALGTTWHYLVATNNNGVATLYVDGINVTTDAGVSPLASGATPVNIGRRSGGASYLIGLIDEVRISPTTRSPNWIDAQHRTQGDAFIQFSN